MQSTASILVIVYFALFPNTLYAEGIRSLILLKTTQSGFENFHRDEFRALGDTNDRLVGTSVDGEWSFSAATIASRPDYESLNKTVLDTLIDEFAGPADKGEIGRAHV